LAAKILKISTVSFKSSLDFINSIFFDISSRISGNPPSLFIILEN